MAPCLGSQLPQRPLGTLRVIPAVPACVAHPRVCSLLTRSTPACSASACAPQSPACNAQQQPWAALSSLASRRASGSPCALQPLRLQQHSQRQRGLQVVRAGGPGGGLSSNKQGKGEEVDTWGKRALVGIAVGYLVLVILVPTANVFYQAFGRGIGPFLGHLQDPDFLHAVKMTLLLAAVAVPINTVFGISMALLIVRNEFPGKLVLTSLLDLPFSISPVVTGLMLVLLYGREGWFAPVLRATGFRVVFAFPGMALATLFVTMPFVVRELIPILEEMDMAEEEAARTLGASDWEVFWNVTLPNIRWGLLYGVILTNARAMGEFGAVSVISGNIIGRTQTLTLFVESAYKEYDTELAFSASVLLSVLALGTLFVKEWLERKYLQD